jgi:hypothetical protein
MVGVNGVLSRCLFSAISLNSLFQQQEAEFDKGKQ